MKIIQTLWLPPDNENALKNTCGWLSPEYHWISWVLSFNQLRKFYNQIELYTNKAGKEVLIDKLKLPYSKVHLVFDDLTIPETSWVYYKVYTYSLQEKPFIHVDGDVYIWDEFPESFKKSPLIAQNQEFIFQFYSETLEHIQKQNISLPPILQTPLPDITYNAGIIGGNDTIFFKEYSGMVLSYIETHYEALKDLPNSNCAMLLEQGIFSILAHQYKHQVACAFKDAVDDFNYPGLSNLYKANEGRLNHFMNLTKRNRFYLKHLSSKLRKESPEQYYAILRLCQESGIELDFKIYGLSELSLSENTLQHFKELLTNFEFQKSRKENTDWQYFYAKDAFIYRQVEYLNSLSDEEVKAIKFLRYSDFSLHDTSTDIVTAQSISIMDTFSLTEIEIVLEDLEIILLDAISETDPISFKDIIIEVSLYFDEADFRENENFLFKIVFEKIEMFIFRGLVRIV